jgi:mono/diheme cytochrome c family protein
MTRLPAGAAAFILAGASLSLAGDPARDTQAFFEKEVRPLLAENCFQCHGEAKQKGGLRLDSLEGVLHGGESGPAVVPGNPAESLLIEAVNHDGLEMPPKGKLSDAQIDALKRWVQIGAPWPGAGHATSSGTPAVRRTALTDEDRAYWFFQPVKAVEPPAVPEGWARNPIDAFILDRLRREGLSPSPEADRRTLIRRLTFDLTGLPPSPEEVEAFENDPAPDAYERLVDRLLDSPRHGEHWARHWLDLVRYAESDGYRQDAYRPDAWLYRDYVIRSLNADKPYDRFVREQIAGDELAGDSPEMKIAAGYFRLGTYEFNQRDVPAQWRAILDDVTDVTSEVFLGLGMGCARCHDHKFDPILQEDYYRLQAFFTPLYPRKEATLATAAEEADHRVAMAAWELATADLRERIAELEADARAASAKGVFDKFPPETKAILQKPSAERTPYERQIAYLAGRQYDEEGAKIETLLQGEVKTRWQALMKELAAFDGIKPPRQQTVLTITDVGPAAPPTVIPGDRNARGIEPGFLAVLGPGLGDPPAITPLPGSTGRRTALADWLTRPDNPMTTRVAVNRVWQYHFGRGIVATSSDFGRLGEPPTHPELLDWLAARFVQDGWSLKSLHRLIVQSATYRQAAQVSPSEMALLKDPDNRLLWRMTPRRLDAEPIRDAMLAVSGELDPAAAGPGVEPSQPRRTVFTKVMRNTRDDLLEAFDAPDASLSTAQRNATVTPTQALLLINGPWSLERARAFASRVKAACPDDPAGQIDLAFRLAFGRHPEPDERADALAFLDWKPSLAGEGGRAAAGSGGQTEVRTPSPADPAALADFCHALLNSNEFLYVD